MGGGDDFIGLRTSGGSNGYGDVNSQDNVIDEEVSQLSWGKTGPADMNHIQWMFPEKDRVGEPTGLQKGVDLIKTASNVDHGNNSQTTFGGNKDCLTGQKERTIISHEMDVTSVSGVKRSRVANEDQQQLVYVKYNSLSRKSKKKLEELLHHWSQWHAKECSNSEDSNELLESGEETYYPALHVGSSPMSFVLDNQVRKKQRKDTFSMNDESVPLYDREYAMSLNTVDGASKVESSLGKLEASRCFNCGSYNHSLKECSKPRDATAVKNARKQHVAKKGHSAGPRVLTRYYQSSPGGKYDGLKPGVLGAETRQLLGLSELDPPPWMNRMREIGYPPGYLDLSEEDKPSGIKIYGDEDSGEQDEAKLKLDETKSIKKMTVDFPGVNAVIPENADPRKWNSISPLPTFNSCVHQSDYRSHSSSEFSNTTYPLDPIWSGGFPRSNYLGISPPIPSYLANYNSYPNVTNNPLVARLSHYVAMQRKSSYSFLPNLSPYSYQSPHR